MSRRFQRLRDFNHLQMWTIYDRPADFPDGFVVREWIAGAGGGPGLALTAPTLEDARDLVPQDCVRMVRQEGDDPKIVETWI